jgi:hypothetical protein
MKPIIFTMASSGIRVCFWDYLKLSHVFAIMKRGKLLAARINVYMPVVRMMNISPS